MSNQRANKEKKKKLNVAIEMNIVAIKQNPFTHNSSEIAEWVWNICRQWNRKQMKQKQSEMKRDRTKKKEINVNEKGSNFYFEIARVTRRYCHESTETWMADVVAIVGCSVAVALQVAPIETRAAAAAATAAATATATAIAIERASVWRIESDRKRVKPVSCVGGRRLWTDKTEELA